MENLVNCVDMFWDTIFGQLTEVRETKTEESKRKFCGGRKKQERSLCTEE